MASSDATRFEWGEGNADKNWLRHRVTRGECESVFFNEPLVVRTDTMHSSNEDRFYALGRTDAGRRLFVVYTFRGENIRVISARDMTPRESRIYSYAEFENSEEDS